MIKRDDPKPEFALTASGRSIELPKPMPGDPVATMEGGDAADEARAHIQRGDLAEALVWIERSSRRFDGLVRLYERSR